MENLEINSQQSNVLLEQALQHQARGWSVIPISRDKKPLIEWKPYQSERASPEQIRQWATQYPNMNIGVVTGAISGIVVIDIEKDGNTSGYPPTTTSRTGGGGWHLFYKHPGVPIKNSARELAPLTDVRGDGGYVVLPPSLHASGNNYQWVVSPEDSGFTDLPEYLLEKLKDSDKKTDWGEFSASQVKEGARNDTAASYAGKLLHDLSPELWETAGWASLKDWNNAHAKPPLPEYELRAVFKSIAQKEVGSRGKKNSERKSGGVKGKALVVRLSDVQPEPISWLWSGRIALGKLTLIAGDPGLGKSLLTATFAAHVSKGYPWPVDGSTPPVGDVVLLSAEDDPADTIRPRLDAAVADCSRVHILKAIKDEDGEGRPTQHLFSFKSDLLALEELLISLPDCKLLVVDPVSAYLDGADSHNNTDVRGLLAPLAELAARYKIAVILIQHLNKSGGGNALYRSIGSIAFIAAARAAYIVTKDPENPTRRLLLPAKNNLAKDDSGLAYSVIEADNGAPVVAWEPNLVEITAAEALALPESNEEHTNTDWAVDLLEELLALAPMPVVEVQKEAHKAGVSRKCLDRAKVKLGIKPKKVGYKEGWVWALPGHEDAPKAEDTLSKTEGILGDEGNLGGAQ